MTALDSNTRSQSLRRIALALCLWFSVASGQVAAAAAGSVPELKGVTLGESLDDLWGAAGTLLGLNCGDHKYSPLVICTFSSTLGGAAANFIVTVRENRVTQIGAAGIDPDDFAGVESALRKKFGKPDSERVGTVANAMGAKFDDRTLVWKRKGWQLQAKKRAGKVNESSVELFSDAEAAITEDLQRAKADDS